VPVPQRIRPKFPSEWHIPNEPKLWITWAHSNKKLKDEQVYWVSTSSLAGKPHAAPVWGIWSSNAFYFETDPDSVKGRNLRRNPKVVVHVQDGLDTVIVEGTAVREKDPAILDKLARNYARKYDYTPNWTDEQAQVVFRVTPKIAHAWRAPRMHRNLVNFVFQQERGSSG
jgi:general stress protein 26